MNNEIIELQETIAHQGQDILRLSDEMYTQQKEIADLRRQIIKLQEDSRPKTDGENGFQSNGQEPPPPHY